VCSSAELKSIRAKNEMRHRTNRIVKCHPCMGSIFQVMYMSLGLTAHEGFSWQKVLAKQFRNKISQQQNEAQHKLQTVWFMLWGCRSAPYGNFKPATVKIGNVLWSSPKNELSLIHNNTCCTLLKMCNQMENPMVPYKSFSSPLPRLQAQQTIKCHPCDKNGPPL
jgi:hypothetical protein